MVEGLKTAYQVGKGYLRDEEDPRRPKTISPTAMPPNRRSIPTPRPRLPKRRPPSSRSLKRQSTRIRPHSPSASPLSSRGTTRAQAGPSRGPALGPHRTPGQRGLIEPMAKVKRRFPHAVETIEHLWIPLPDWHAGGQPLAAARSRARSGAGGAGVHSLPPARLHRHERRAAPPLPGGSGLRRIALRPARPGRLGGTVRRRVLAPGTGPTGLR